MIKLLTLSDLHLQSSRPRARLDKNFVVTQLRKLAFILKECNKRKVDALLLAGDVFDTAFVNYELLANIIQLFLRYLPDTTLPIAVYGQHDLRYHSLKQIKNTPLSVLLTAIRGKRATDEPIYLSNNVCVKGASYGENIPLPEQQCFNMLLLHRMIVKDEPEPYLRDYVKSKVLLEKTGYDLVISGDNHQSFYVQLGNKLLINNGSVLRTRTDQYNHIPRVSYIEIDDNRLIKQFKWIEIPCKPSHLVLKDREEEKVEQETKINEIISRLMEKKEVERKSFTASLARVARKTENKRIKMWLEKLLEQMAKEREEEESV